MNPFRSSQGHQKMVQDELRVPSVRVEQLEHEDADDEWERMSMHTCDSRVFQEHNMNICYYEVERMEQSEEQSLVQDNTLTLRVPPIRLRRLHGRRPYDRSPAKSKENDPSWPT